VGAIPTGGVSTPLFFLRGSLWRSVWAGWLDGRDEEFFRQPVSRPSPAASTRARTADPTPFRGGVHVVVGQHADRVEFPMAQGHDGGGGAAWAPPGAAFDDRVVRAVRWIRSLGPGHVLRFERVDGWALQHRAVDGAPGPVARALPGSFGVVTVDRTASPPDPHERSGTGRDLLDAVGVSGESRPIFAVTLGDAPWFETFREQAERLWDSSQPVLSLQP
jgi:hypothetical protein